MGKGEKEVDTMKMTKLLSTLKHPTFFVYSVTNIYKNNFRKHINQFLLDRYSFQTIRKK